MSRASRASSHLIDENATSSIRRLWIDGSGRPPEYFAQSLPGIPDNISFDDEGLLWVALAFLREPGAERLMAHPQAIKILLRLITLVPSAVGAPYGFVIALDPQGRVVHNLQDPEGRRRSHVTSVVRHDDHLYFGSYVGTAVGRLRLP